MAEGILVVNDRKQIRIKFTNLKGKEVEMAVPVIQLSQSLTQKSREKIDDLNGLKVQFDEEQGQPKRVREVGQPFVSPNQMLAPANNPNNHRGGNPQPAFHNPYNFVPAPPREQGNTPPGPLDDQTPVGHQVLHPDRYTGRLRVKMKVETPLLVPDSAKVDTQENDHKSFPIRMDQKGRPLVPPTSIKGMLRSAYEAVTNSRLSVFSKHQHKDRLAERMPPRDGLSMVPARIIKDSGIPKIALLTGSSGMTDSGRPNNGDPMYAAWLPRYERNGPLAQDAIRYPDGNLPTHGHVVWVWLELWEKQGPNSFKYWSVRKCVRENQDQELGNAPPAGGKRGSHRPVPERQMQQVKGYVCITNRNIDRKHDERVFFSNSPVYHELTEEFRKQWRELITNYQTIHQEERKAGMTGPPALQNSVWSRHIAGGSGEQELSDGTLCYATVSNGQIKALYPVMISRRLFESSPLSLLPESLHPAESLKELSPADRVFGWVNQAKKGAFKGNLRIGQVKCQTDDAIESFDRPGMPLAILGQPQPQQARFYVAASSSGKSQSNGQTKEEVGYKQGKGLRGRKVYPHHRRLDEREYRMNDVRNNQNRSIQGWVKPDTEFSFDIQIINLSSVELGALIWLLSLPDQHFHRLGGGKPLGFGSVRLELDCGNCQINNGEAWKKYYTSLDGTIPGGAEPETLVNEFKTAVANKYPHAAGFESIPFIDAWLRMATGHQDLLPTHYPRAADEPNAAGENFKWFSNNERNHKVCLGDLANDRGLPF